MAFSLSALELHHQTAPSPFSVFLKCGVILLQALSMLGLFMPTLRESVEMLYEWEKPFIMDSSKAEKAFGWQGTSLKDAMRATIDWCKEK